MKPNLVSCSYVLKSNPRSFLSCIIGLLLDLLLKKKCSLGFSEWDYWILICFLSIVISENALYGHGFTCPKCQRVYQMKYSLKRHMEYSCGVGPRFLCRLCPYRAFCRISLVRHLREKHETDQTELMTFQ